MDPLLLSLIVALSLVTLPAVACLHAWFWRSRWRLPLSADEQHHVRCDDGWVVALHRYRPAERVHPEPVLLCHGVGADASTFDLGPELSLAHHLRAQGYEVWSLELRGFSSRTNPKLGDGRSWDILFEDFVDRDGPAAIEHVLARTGAERLHWIGHSMGGMIGAALAQTPWASRLASLVIIGTPMRVLTPAWLRALARVGHLAKLMPFVPFAWLSWVGLALPLANPIVSLFFWRKNAASTHIRQVMANTSRNLPGALAAQLCGWGIAQRVVAQRDARDFTADLARIHTPLLGFGGQQDRIAPSPAVRFTVEQTSSPDKRFVLLDGYGHLDLVMGTHAKRDVFDPITAWLHEHAAPLPAPSALLRDEPAAVAHPQLAL